MGRNLPADYSDWGTATPINSDGTPLNDRVASAERGRANRAKGYQVKLVPDTTWMDRIEEEPVRADELTLTIPIKTVSRVNIYGQTGAKIKRPATERNATHIVFLKAASDGKWGSERKATMAKGCTVKMTRIGPRTLDDDNLPAALKSIRDQIAVEILDGTPGQRDHDPVISWEYSQAFMGRQAYGVVVTIKERGK